MIVRVEHGSIGDAKVSVLVNASNTILRLGTGVSAAIGASCGKPLRDELEQLRVETPDGWEPGAVAITSAGNHPHARYVAHVAVMDYRPIPNARPRPDLNRIRLGYENLWSSLAQLDGPLSVGTVALGAGTGGLGLRDSIRIACETLKQAAPNNIGSVTFVAYQLHELVNTVAVVRDHFDLPLDDFDPELIRLVDT